ncbi:hypothetical protein D3C87_756550 [compost metagenome]
MAASETTAETGTVPETTAERRVPPAGATVRRAKTEDFAFLSRLPARKPEIFDRDAINRAALLVGGLALGLWVVMIIARPGTPPESEPIPESFIQEAPPITSTGNGLAPAPQELAPPPEVISLTPAPSWTPPPPAPEQPPAMQAPAMRAPAAQPPAIQPGAVNGYPDAGIEEVAPSVADTPDPSNLFSTP